MAGFCIVLLMGMFSSVILFFVILLLAYLLICLFNYFMESFALYRMCQNNKYKYPILAWIPYYNRVLLGDMANDKNKGYIIFILRAISLLLVILVSYLLKDNINNSKGLINMFNNITFIISFIAYILDIMLVHKIMKKTFPNGADVLTVLNVITLGISKSIVLFILRNNKKLIK